MKSAMAGFCLAAMIAFIPAAMDSDITGKDFKLSTWRKIIVFGILGAGLAWSSTP